MRINPRVWMRKTHRWGAVLIALPFLVILVTGLLLQLKKEWAWVQPPTRKGNAKILAISFDKVLAATRGVPEAEVSTWDDVDRLDVRPDRGMLKVQCKNRWEVQLDTHTGKVIQVAYRRSDLIEALHDGSWFHDQAKLWVFLPTAFVVLVLWLTGIYLFVLPWWVKGRRGGRPLPPPTALERRP